MPQLALNGASIHYELRGDGTETVVFAHGLLLSARIFADQVAALQRHYRCLTFDFRGHGQTSATRSAYDLDMLHADTVGVIEALGASPCHYVGFSLGGMIGLRIALCRPELLKSLALLSTTAEAETNFNKALYRLLSLVALLFGLRPVAGRMMSVMFGRTLLKDPARAELKHQWEQHLIGNGRLKAACAVQALLSRKCVLEQLGQITTPTLIAVGEEDPAVKKGEASRIHSRIRDSRLVRLSQAGHLLTVEVPETVNELLEGFFSNGRSPAG